MVNVWITNYFIFSNCDSLFFDRKIISIKEPVKEVGLYKAIVKLHKDVAVEIEFEVVAE